MSILTDKLLDLKAVDHHAYMVQYVLGIAEILLVRTVLVFAAGRTYFRLVVFRYLIVCVRHFIK